MQRPVIRLPFFALLAFAWAGCATTSTLDGTEWTLLRVETPDGALTLEGMPPNLLFDGERIAGSDGCNQFTGSFTATSGGLTTSQLVSTKRACPPPVDALSRAVLGTLDAARLTTEVEDDELRLTAGETVLVYTRR